MEDEAQHQRKLEESLLTTERQFHKIQEKGEGSNSSASGWLMVNGVGYVRNMMIQSIIGMKI